MTDNYSKVSNEVYDLDDFDNKHSIFKQLIGYISNNSSTGNALDKSNNK